MIRAWLARRAENARLRAYKQGWDWAAGRLLEGEAPEEVEKWAEYGRDFDGPNPWDQGIADACRAWPAAEAAPDPLKYWPFDGSKI